jgi:hypothetical protein
MTLILHGTQLNFQWQETYGNVVRVAGPVGVRNSLYTFPNIIVNNPIVPAAKVPSNLGSQGPAVYLSNIWV